MKPLIFVLTLLFLAAQAIACSCDSPGIVEKYLEADFVASIKVTKVYPNTGAAEIYRSDIRINEVFKGKPLSFIYVYGRSDGGLGSSCAIFIPENTELIAYAYENENGQMAIGMCSDLLYLNRNKSARQLARQKKELQILRTYQALGLADSDDRSFWNDDLRSRGLVDSLEQFDGITLDKSFAIYEISFTADLVIDTVNILSGFGDPIDSKLISTLKNCDWAKQLSITNDIHPEERKQLIGVYYYPAKADYPSFLSYFYH